MFQLGFSDLIFRFVQIVTQSDKKSRILHDVDQKEFAVYLSYSPTQH